MLSIIIVKAKQEKNAFSLNSAPAELIRHKTDVQFPYQFVDGY